MKSIARIPTFLHLWKGIRDFVICLQYIGNMGDQASMPYKCVWETVRRI